MVNVNFEHRVTQKNNYRRTRARRVINFPCTDTISGLGILIMWKKNSYAFDSPRNYRPTIRIDDLLRLTHFPCRVVEKKLCYVDLSRVFRSWPIRVIVI